MTPPAVLDESAARQALVEAARRLDAAGLNVNASGNLSVRVGGDVLVTPSGVRPDAMTLDSCVLLDAAGAVRRRGEAVPTSEWRLHVELYRRRPDVAAVVHTHSLEATAASTLGRSVPAVHYVVARFGGPELVCAPYATYGSDELARHVADALGDVRTACLMANHGAIAVAADLGTAVALALDVEWLCGVHRRAVALGTPNVLDDDEIARVAERFTTYGQPTADRAASRPPTVTRRDGAARRR
jgi:L-fuculose-phosphate aldolase